MATGDLAECLSTPDFEGFGLGEGIAPLVKAFLGRIKALEEDGDKVRKRMSYLEKETN